MECSQPKDAYTIRMEEMNYLYCLYFSEKIDEEIHLLHSDSQSNPQVVNFAIKNQCVFVSLYLNGADESPPLFFREIEAEEVIHLLHSDDLSILRL